MRCSRSSRPDGRRSSLSAIAICVAVGAALAGCSASRQTQDYQSYAGARPIAQPVVAAPAVAKPPKIVIEGDGLPSQAPPQIRRFAEPDDPSEPFSPNYGPKPEEPAGREDVPPAVTQPPLRKARMSDREAERLIARAIAEHEIRQP